LKQTDSSFTKSLAYFQTLVKNSGPIATASYGLIGGIILFTLLGLFLDNWLGTEPWIMMIGLGIGLISGFYGIGKIIWRK